MGFYRSQNNQNENQKFQTNIRLEYMEMKMENFLVFVVMIIMLVPNSVKFEE